MSGSCPRDHLKNTRMTQQDSVFSAFAGAAVLDTTPIAIRSILTRATSDELAWRPGEERWSIAMVLAHLADVEVNGFQSRFRALAADEDPFLPIYDQHALFRQNQTIDPWQSLDSFAEQRERTIDLLRSLPSSIAARRGRHEELAQGISFGELLNEFAFHDLGHIRQIAELYRARAFYPVMGAFRSYYQIHP